MKKVLLIFALFGLLSSLLVSCGSATTQANNHLHVVRVALLPFTGYAPIYVADQEHLCARYGIQLQVIDTGSQSALDTIMAKGDADAGMYANTNLAFADAAGLPLQAFLTLDESVGADGVVVSENIHSIQDMVKQHTKFAADETDVNYFLFMAVAEKQGFKTTDFNHIPLTGGDALAAFLTGQIDAIGISAPDMQKALQRKGAHILFTSKNYPGYISDVFVAKQTTIQQKASDLAAFARCWYDTITHIKADSNTAYPIMAKSLGVDVAEMQQLVPGILWPDVSAGRSYLTGGGLQNSLAFTNDFYSRLGQLTGTPVAPEQQISDTVEKLLT